jgi:hypothetical protein
VLVTIVKKMVALVNFQQTLMFVVQEETAPILCVLAMQVTLEVNVKFQIVLETIQPLQMFAHPMESVCQQTIACAMLVSLEQNVTFKIALESCLQTPTFVMDEENALAQINVNAMPVI